MLVLDRINGVAYVALSERADKSLAEVRRVVLRRALVAAPLPLLPPPPPQAPPSNHKPRPAHQPAHAPPLHPPSLLVQRWVAEMGYKELVSFKSTDARGGTVYHTNVMMAVGTDVAVVCLESVEDERERRHLR